MPELGEVWLKIRQLQLGGEKCNDVVVDYEFAIEHGHIIEIVDLLN